MQSCSIICGNSLATRDRATAMSCYETLAAGVLGLLGPMVGASLVATFGGITLHGIRPLFYISLADTLSTFILVRTQLSNRNWERQGKTKRNMMGDLFQVFKYGHNLKRFLLISTIIHLPYGMLIPFTQPFAHEVKGADEFVLGSMVTGCALTPLLFGIPLGRLADRIDRKKVLCLIAPLFWVSRFFII